MKKKQTGSLTVMEKEKILNREVGKEKKMEMR